MMQYLTISLRQIQRTKLIIEHHYFFPLSLWHYLKINIFLGEYYLYSHTIYCRVLINKGIIRLKGIQDVPIKFTLSATPT